MKLRSAFAVLSMTVALSACGELPFPTASEPAAQGHVGPPGVSPLEQPIETGGQAKPVATAEASTMGTAMFRASGSGWTVTAADKTAVYERPGARSVGVGVRRLTYARGVEFIGTMNGSVFSLNVQAQPCEAGGQKSPFTAKLRVGSQRLSGCAVQTDTMPKAQTRASSAAPKPKTQVKPVAPKPAPTPAPTPAPATTQPAPAATATPAESAAPEAASPATATTGATTGATTSTGTENAVPAPQLTLPPTPPAPTSPAGSDSATSESPAASE